MARDFLVEAFQTTIEHVNASLEPPLDLLEASGDAWFELPDRVADFDQRVSVFARLAFEVRHSFFDGRHPDLLEHTPHERVLKKAGAPSS